MFARRLTLRVPDGPEITVRYRVLSGAAASVHAAIPVEERGDAIGALLCSQVDAWEVESGPVALDGVGVWPDDHRARSDWFQALPNDVRIRWGSALYSAILGLARSPDPSGN